MYRDVPISILSTSTPVLDLASLKPAGDSQITITFGAIVMASATLVFTQSSDTSGGRACP